jgi:hypothetical protein
MGPVGGESTARRATWMDLADRWFTVFSGLAVLWLAFLLLRVGVRPGWPSLLLVVFWVFFTYLALPRLHRILTRIYVPAYFIGRTRTSDGLLGDPVNLALRGDEDQIHHAMTSSGWTRADDLTFGAGRRIVTSTLRRRSYPAAPVSPLHLFERRQDFAYERELAGSPAKRHHVRFWRCPDGWLLPGGFDVDWLAAGTFDRSVGLSLFTLQVTHKIDARIDHERDFVVATVTEAVPGARLEVLKDFATGYHARNGGGDLIETDGDLPIIDLGGGSAPGERRPFVTDSRDRRPSSTVFGVVVALLRGCWYAYLAGLIATIPHSLDLVSDLILPDLRHPTALLLLFAVPFLVLAVIDLGLALAVLAGRNWARLCLMGVCALSTVSAFVAAEIRDERPVGLGNLPVIGGSILVLLALSSRRAREFATRRSRGVADAVPAAGP